MFLAYRFSLSLPYFCVLKRHVIRIRVAIGHGSIHHDAGRRRRKKNTAFVELLPETVDGSINITVSSKCVNGIDAIYLEFGICHDLLNIAELRQVV
jgi:hypothetical protein